MNFLIKNIFRESIKWNVVFLSMVVFTVFFIPVFSPAYQKMIYDIAFTLIFLLGYLISDRMHPVILPLSIGAVIVTWTSAIFKLKMLFYLSSSLNLVFFAIVVFTLIKHLAISKTVTFRLILDSIIIYLLIGLIFSIIVGFIYGSDPTAFSFTGSGNTSAVVNRHDFIYFTFVTLTTTGFGDIVPVQPYARSLTIFIAITGQIYIAIIISMLVGKYAALRHEDRNEE